MANVEHGIAQRAIIAIDGAEIYSLPWADGSPITVLSKGDTVNIIGKRGEWVKIRFANGKKGWMPIQRRKQHPPTNGTHKTNGKAPDLVTLPVTTPEIAQ